MAWRMRSKPQVLQLTKKMAEEWRDMEEVREDRPLKERRLMVYRKVLQAGEFRPVNWAKVFVKEMNQEYRVNGKHTSTVFAESDLSKCQKIIVVVEDYEVDTIEDAAKLYATFDSNLQVRNQSDVNRMFAASIPELKDRSQKFINLLVGAINYFTNPGLNTATDNSNRVTAAERAECMFDEIEFAEWLFEIIGENNYERERHLFRVPVIAAMRGCWGKSKSAATEFWKAVRDETGENPNLPDRKLAKWLTLMRVKGGGDGRTPSRFKVMPREFYVKCIHAWNAWRKKESTNLQYFAAAKIPSFV